MNNDTEIKNMKELPKVVAGTPVGKSVPLVILRNEDLFKKYLLSMLF